MANELGRYKPLNDDITDELKKLTGFEITKYDYISLTYDGSNLTGVVYKTGGSTGTTVATLTLTWDANDNPLTIERT